MTGAVAGLLVAAAIVGPSALASGGDTPTSPPATKAAQGPGASCPAPDAKAQADGSKAASAAPGPGPFLAAVAQLAQAGTINDAQARVLDAGIRAGSIDDQQLVANGTLSSAQMRAVDDRLKAVKLSLIPAGQDSGAGHAKAPPG